MKAPSVIIGVGGIGSQICAKVEQELNRVKGQKSGELENTRFVAIDTDVNSLRELYRGGFRGRRILLTDNMTVAKCRDIIDDPSINDWYPENTIFSKKSMTEGAGQQRSISRLAFEYCVRDGRLNQLDNVVRELNELVIDDSSQQTRFYIISSLAGGTGSGVILPLAMYLNRFIQGEQGDNLAICKGFFILSSAFYPSCGSELEKKSLDANAYAAVKELSAFMRSADNVAAKSHMSYPLSGFEDYSGSTYEYCYLFGLTNAKAKNIHSFEELKRTVADAVYMQACSPMNERNSSREDNTIRHAAMLGQEKQENWLRRFGGIGCGRLVYPWQDLKNYFGLCWAKDTMEGEWRKYDEEYKKERKKIITKKRVGQKRVELDQGECYIRAIDRAEPSDWLAALVRAECGKREDVEPWNSYLNALEEKALADINSLLEDYINSSVWKSYDQNREDIALPGRSRQIASERYEHAMSADRNWARVKEELKKRKDALAEDSRLFRLHPWDPSTEEDVPPTYYLEHWLLTEERKFLHPNSVRYTLYQLEKAIALHRQIPEDSCDLSSPFKQNKKNRLNFKDGKKLAKAFDNKMGKLSKALKDELINQFLIDCESYVKKLIKCYEEFFGNYDIILEEFNMDIRTIEKKLDRVSGVAYSYVCADRVCREKLHEELSERRCYEEGAVSGISYELFQLIHEENLEPNKMATRECANKIKDFWRKGIGKDEIGKEILDMNILEAMNKEEECHTGNRLTEADFEAKIQQVQNVLVAPFLQYFQRIDMNTGISLCCYHNSLKNTVGVYRNVVEWMDDHNAVDDDTYCDKREIMFYRSFVGLEAYEVLDYLHGISAKTAVCGRAFRSYQSMLNNMGKSAGDASKVITPHADTRWHSLYNMPDPSGKYQEEQEKYIAVALLYAWLSGKIEHTEGISKYRFTFLGKITEEFNRLYDFHLRLYGNYYLYMELCRDMREDIRAAQKTHEDCYKKITRGSNRSAFDFIIEYQESLEYGERSGMQQRLLADAAKTILYVCTEAEYNQSRKDKCIKTINEQITQTCHTLQEKKFTVNEKKEIFLNDSFVKDLQDFFSDYQGNLKIGEELKDFLIF